MKICCVSDLHGYLPEIPDCDLLLIGGDLVFGMNITHSANWLRSTMRPWLADLSKRMTIVGVAGNHDFVFQLDSDLVPRMNWTYLQDSGTEFRGLKIWGSPWQPYFGGWAFNLYEPELCEKWKLVPDDTDILLLHGPPLGYGDFSPVGRVHTGSPGLLNRILAIKPKLVVAGHIHSGYGRYNIGETLFVSASLANEQYVPVNQPIIVEL